MVREERLAYKELRRVDDNEGADDDEEEPGDATELRSLVCSGYSEHQHAGGLRQRALAVRAALAAQLSGPLSELLRELALPVLIPLLLVFTAWSTLTPVLPLLVLDMGGGAAQVGVLTGARAIGGMAATMPAGYATSRYGCRATILVGSALYCAGCVGGAFSTSVSALVATRALCGVAYALCTVAPQTYVRLSVPAAFRGRVLATLGGLYRIGGFVGPLAGGAAAQWSGFRSPFWIQVVATAAAAAMVAAYMPDERAVDDDAAGAGGASGGGDAAAVTQPAAAAVTPPAAAAEGSASAQPVRRGLAYHLRADARLFAPVLLATCVLALVRSVRELLVPLAAAEQGMSRAGVGAVTSLSYVGEMLFFPAAGWMMDAPRFGRRHAGVASQAGMGAAMLLMGLCPRSSAVTMVSGALMGTANALSSGLLMTLCADCAPRECAGEATGFFLFLNSVGGVIGPTAIGALAEATSLRTACFASTALAGAGCLVWAFVLPETRQAQKQAMAHAPANTKS